MATPISPALKTSARSAYRALLRASGATFSGDDRVLYAFRDKVRTETVAGRQEADPTEYEARVQHAFEVATVLRKNFVQGTKEGETYRLRITSDTELGTNEGVKAPYSRPERGTGTPRLKCGEDPNAVAPLPPKSLRASLGATGSTRSYSTQASSTELEPETELDHNKARVQSLVDKLSQVNRRVSASMVGKGKEVVVERVLLEDKIGALAARIEYLAQTHTPANGKQSALDTFLDIVWLNPEDVATAEKRSDPPVQMRQFVRYLYRAGKEATGARKAAMSLSPEIRTAIGEEMETPAPGTKVPGAHTPADELRDITWRTLMVKRGMQRVVAVAGENVSGLGALVGSVRRTLTQLTYAQQCLDDLEENGPRNEDVGAIAIELERGVESPTGSPMFEMMRAIQERIEQGTVWQLADEERERCRSVKFGKDVDLTGRPRYRQPYHYLRHFEEEQAPPPAGSAEHTLWRREQLIRVRGIIDRVNQKIGLVKAAFDELIVIYSENHKHSHKAAALETAKSTFTPHDSQHIRAAIKLARVGTMLEWANILGNIREQTKVIETQLRTVDPIVRSFSRSQPMEELLANKRVQKLFVDIWLETTLAFDCIWRVNRRLKQDKVAMIGIARELERKTLRATLTKDAKSRDESLVATPEVVPVRGRQKDKPSDRSTSPIPRTPRFADRNNVRSSKGALTLLDVFDRLLEDEKGFEERLKESPK